MASFFCPDCDDVPTGHTTTSLVKGPRCRVCAAEMLPVPPAITAAPVDAPSTIEQWFATMDEDLRQALENVALRMNPTRELAGSVTQTLGRLKVDIRQTVLVDAVLQLGPIAIPTVLAEFSSIPMSSMSLKGRVVCGSPVYGEGEPESSDCTGNFLLLQRGKVSFAKKVLFASKLNAAALLIVQSEGHKWPFQMTDSAGELAALTGAAIAGIPVLMISHHDCDALLKYSRKSDVELQMVVGGLHDCAVCRDDFSVGQNVLKLDCRHCYHAECLARWLEKHNSCPLCRARVMAQRPINSSAGMMAT